MRFGRLVFLILLALSRKVVRTGEKVARKHGKWSASEKFIALSGYEDRVAKSNSHRRLVAPLVQLCTNGAGDPSGADAGSRATPSQVTLGGDERENVTAVTSATCDKRHIDIVRCTV